MRRAAVLLASLAALLPIAVAGQPLTLSQRARNVLAEAIGDTPHWKDARIAQQGIPLFRPDIKTVAYYEFPVVGGSGGVPSGSILLATDRHDYPVVQWGTRGASIVEQLALKARSLGKTPHRFYLLDAFSFAVEDSQGRLIAQLGDAAIPTAADGWRKFKRDYAVSRAAYLRLLREKAEGDWTYWDKPTAQKLGSCGDWEYHYAGSDDDQRLYWQLQAGQGPNNSPCSSGTGATAWAMLFGWIDNRAAGGDSAWPKDAWGVLVGDADSGAIAQPWPVNTGSEDVFNMIWELRNDLETSCGYGGGLVWPWKMGNASKYLQRRIRPALWALTTEWTYLSTPTDDKRDAADAVIRSGRPVITQVGWERFVLAYGYRKKICTLGRDVHEFKINEGQFGDLRWTSASTSFVGHVAAKDIAGPPGSYWASCRPPPNECDQWLVCHDGYCRRYPAEGEPCFTWTDKPQCALALQCRDGKCERPPSVGKCTACVPGESSCNLSGCPLGMECFPGTNPTCIGGSSATGNTSSPNTHPN